MNNQPDALSVVNPEVPSLIERDSTCPENGQSACTSMILPVRDALDILSGKWKIPIIIALTFGTKRFGQIAKEIPGITDKMLAKELRDLEQNELVRRTVHDSYPVVIDYSLTPYAKSLRSVIEELRSWGLEHRKRIMNNQ